MSVISIVNQKGGVGKTTTTVNLARYLTLNKKRVLLIDLDPQGNATTGVGIEKGELASSVYNVIIDKEEIQDHLVENTFDKLDVLPAKIDLAGAEVELVSKMSRENRMKNAIDSMAKKYDFVLIDCPPSLGLLTLNALTASKAVIIPIQCEFYALEGLTQLINTIDLVRSELNKKLEIMGILMTMYDSRTRLSEEVATEVKRFFKEKVFDTVIPRNIKLSEAPSFGKPINEYDSSSKGAIAYEAFAKEVIKRGSK